MRLFFATILLFGCLQVQAARTVTLFDESAILTLNASPIEQNLAVRDALERVLVRVTGDQDVANKAAAQSMLLEANNYLATFRFTSHSEVRTNLLGEAVSTQKMLMQFSENQVLDVLSRSRLPIWSQNRPEVLVIIADRLSGSERILNDSQTSSIRDSLKQTAQLRGIPILLPVMDLQDTLALDFDEIFMGDSPNLTTVANRYQADESWLLSIVKTNNLFQGRSLAATTQNNLADRAITFTAESPEEVAAHFVHLIADHLAERYAVTLNSASNSSFRLRIENIHELADFAQVESYLNSLNRIDRLGLKRVVPSAIEFDITVNGNINQLINRLRLDNRLIAVTTDTLTKDADTPQLLDESSNPETLLIYQWQP